MPLFGGELLRPSSKGADGCRSHPELADPSDKLEHETLNFPLQIELAVFVVETLCADQKDQYRSDSRQCSRNQRKPEVVIEHQNKTEPAKHPGQQATQSSPGKDSPGSVNSQRSSDKIADRVLAEERSR